MGSTVGYFSDQWWCALQGHLEFPTRRFCCRRLSLFPLSYWLPCWVDHASIPRCAFDVWRRLSEQWTVAYDASSNRRRLRVDASIPIGQRHSPLLPSNHPFSIKKSHSEARHSKGVPSRMFSSHPFNQQAPPQVVEYS